VRVLLAGTGLTILVAAILVAWLGRPALVPALVMGATATGIELMATRWLARGLRTSNRDTMQAFVAGMLFRLLGVGLFAGLVVWNRGTFLPLATGLAYVGVVIPLLFLEARLLR
jgi:fructose-specific phosphotransferase system IIC component